MNPPDSPTAPQSNRARRDRHVDGFIALVFVVSLAAAGLVAWIEFSRGISPRIDWTLFSLFALLLLIGETTSATWLRIASGGFVTMSWTFAFSLVLLGSPAFAVGAIALTTLVAELKAEHDIRRVVFNSAQVSLALALGGLTLFAFGIHEPITGDGSIPVVTGLAILCSGLVVFVTNGMMVCYLISVANDERFMRTMRDGFAVSMTADGALLALAPIFVISVTHSWLMVPLLAIAAGIVYQSAVHAIDRAHEANHDTLTELRNRRSFVAETDQYLTERLDDQSATVLLIDLDGFKGINDRLGHQVGDAVLKAFAERLSAALPAGSIAARLGGDEFAALIPDVRSGTDVFDPTALHEQLVAPTTIEGFPLSVGASIGVARCPEHGEVSGELLHAADIAMYRAKQFQTGVEHHEVTTQASRGRRTLLTSLADAIAEDQLSLEYVPLVHVRDRAVLSVEAKLRWNHPTLGVLAPSEFIGLAEQTDLIGPITEFVIERAVRDIDELDDRALSLSVNVSAGVLHNPQFAKRTLSTLHRLDFEPHRLELEITERCLSADPGRSRATLAQLRAAGVRISIDDFGTGYSSFLTLRELKIDRLKIDRAFVRGLDTADEDRVIVQSVIDLAHGLGIDVVGVGVESEPEWKGLATMGCDLAQGPLIAPPMDIDDFAYWLIKRASSGFLPVAQ
ncbi:MAG: EAL domain-containing protein [Ilumatobacter sp.]|nr:EAL domain-containing protein [Ilumatobacter sp.]